MPERPVILWFRRDLRLADNPALHAACRSGAPVICLYVLDEAAARPFGGASRWWLDKSLRSLASSLAAKGARLELRRGQPVKLIAALARQTNAVAVYFNRAFDPDGAAKDRGAHEALALAGVETHRFNGSLLVSPDDLRTGEGRPYRVFSAFWRAASALAGASACLPEPAAVRPYEGAITTDELGDWALHPTAPDWSHGFVAWRPGEAGAIARLQDFLHSAVDDYPERRDRPDLEATSRLSPHLAFGEISPRQVWECAEAAAHDGASHRGVELFQKELGWREFNHHLLHHFPRMTSLNLDRRFDAFPWASDPAALEAWSHGRTGFPIVDAGMRQLWSSGWMHNRVRMIVASFLVKDLLIDWREGEAWFWDTLVDADEANNVGGWQWTAGSGADAAPYFRVFNPVLQGVKFDPAGAYVRRWVPELAALPPGCIHTPWTAGPDVLAKADVVLGRTYPAPIVDHAAARSRALARFEELR
ncbi:MAG TPA: deoxyribodipyrimidine photo-lyase [Caulobacteraceae bacterium]|nr:deoxyribodipyrimidine photo-lyase [Caulobacteraceae bacterium]